MLTISVSKEEIEIIKNIITYFNDYAVAYETDDGKTYFQTEDGFKYKLVVK